MDSVDMYDIDNDTWSSVPNMRIGKYDHSFCTVGEFLYSLFGIFHYQQPAINVIERFHAQKHVENQSVEWTIFELASGIIEPRSKAMVSSISNTELVILGGLFGDTRNDVIILNTETRIAETEIPHDVNKRRNEGYGFCCYYDNPVCYIID